MKKVYQSGLILMLGVASLFANEFLKNLPENSWYEVPNSNLTKVGAPDVGQYAVSGPKGVTAFSGGAYDPIHKRFIVFGGGHADYAGNELYHFEMDSLKWVRFTEPDTFLQSDNNVEPNRYGRPISRHTYDGLAYIKHADRFFAFGGAMSLSGWSTNTTWTFNPNNKTWQYMQPTGTLPGSEYDLSCAYDEVTKNIYLVSTAHLFKYSYDENKWTRIYEWWQNNSGEKQAFLDTKRRRFVVRAKSGYYKAWDIDSSKTVAPFVFTGDSVCMTTTAPVNIDYDQKADKYLGIYSDGVVFIADPDSLIWRRKTTTGGPTNTGWIFGNRWCYIAEDNVFFCMTNDANANVWFYKHTSNSSSRSEISVNKGAIANVSVAPLPISNSANVMISFAGRINKLTKLQMIDVTGKVLSNLKYMVESGNSISAKINAKNIVPGTYYVKAVTDRGTIVKRIAVVR
ncbi:MAG: T9SS type A sorting domain-containing protein [Fibrobacteres bacterium]|nr:T9SS type A sorting domain-containing protein [Fibrobacterota bacterium]